MGISPQHTSTGRGRARRSSTASKRRVVALAAGLVVVLGVAAAVALARQGDEFVYFIPTTVPDGLEIQSAGLITRPPQAQWALYTPDGEQVADLMASNIQVSVARGDEAGSYESVLLMDWAPWECCQTVRLATGDAVKVTVPVFEADGIVWMLADGTRMYAGGQGVSDDVLVRAARGLEAGHGLTTTVPSAALPPGWSVALRSAPQAISAETKSVQVDLGTVSQSQGAPGVESQLLASVTTEASESLVGEDLVALDSEEALTVRGRPALQSISPPDDTGQSWSTLRWMERESVKITIWSSSDVDAFALAEGLHEVGKSEWGQYARAPSWDTGYQGQSLRVLTFPQESDKGWLERARRLGEYACSSAVAGPEEIEVRLPEAQTALFPDRADTPESQRTILCNEEAKRMASYRMRERLKSALSDASARLREALRSAGGGTP